MISLANGNYMKHEMKLLTLIVGVLLQAAVAFCAITADSAVAGEPPAKSVVHATEPATLPTSAPSPFTEVQLAKFNRYWDTRTDKEIKIIAKYSRLLGLTKGDEVILARKISGKDDDKVYHLFSRLNNGAGYFLTREPALGEMRLYWVGFDFKVIAAISVSKVNNTAVLPVQDAEQELQSELADWAKVADSL